MAVSTDDRLMPGGWPSRYPKEFRTDAARKGTDWKRKIADAAEGVSVADQPLGKWVREEPIDRRKRAGLSTEDHQVVARPGLELGRDPFKSNSYDAQMSVKQCVYLNGTRRFQRRLAVPVLLPGLTTISSGSRPMGAMAKTDSSR
jgi:transposase-like protein